MTRSLVEKPIKRRRIYRGRAVDFCVDRVRLPNGRSARREYMGHPGAAAVVPFTSDGKVVLVRQFRYPVGRTTYELPAGKIDAGEPPIRCVRRELKEETGYTGGRFRPLIRFWPTAAFSNEMLHVYVADGLRPGRRSLDEDEFLEVVELPFKTALRWVASGRIRDSKTIIGLQACALNGEGAKRRTGLRSAGRRR